MDAQHPGNHHLIARSRPLDTPVDPIDIIGADGIFWHRGPLSIGAVGAAVTLGVHLDDPTGTARVVTEALESIEVHDEIRARGSGPLALGALPFDRSAEGTLVIPELAVVRGPDERCWVTTVTGPEREIPDLETRLGSLSDSVDPTSFTVSAAMEPTLWCDAVARARSALEAGRADKVVLARAIEVMTDVAIPRATVLDRLRRTFSSCMVYGLGDLVGASPELLVSREGETVRSHPMAGTIGRSDDPVLDAELREKLANSTKDRIEHRYTIDMVHEILLPWCSWLDEEAEPSIVEMANVRHLATLVEGKLSSPVPSVVELMAALHPTPAVCGSPREQALALIDELEGLDRGCYSGPVGWVDRDGDGEWAVAIRCAELKGDSARLMAGVGVVADSDPSSELAETRAKLQAMLSAIVRP